MEKLYYERPPETNISCNGEMITVKRCGYFKHNLLNKALLIVYDGKPEDKIQALDDYMTVACNKNLNEFTPTEFISSFAELVKLNEVKKIFEWQKPRPDIDGKEREKITTTVDYDDRHSAIMVDMIASQYGWSIEQIYEAQPELIYGLAQEINIRQYEERQFAYGLSVEVAYDKNGRFIPFPKPEWYSEIHGKTSKEIETIKVPASFMPSGVVIDYEAEQNKNR